MFVSGKVVFSSFVLLGVVLGGCQLLKKGNADDAGLDGAVEDASPAAVDTAAAADGDASAAPSTSATTPTTVTRIVPRTDGGLSDAGAVVVVDAGAVAAVDAGAAQECCCEAAGFPLQSVAMSDCNKTRKGQCVKKERCEAAPAPVAPTPVAPTPAEPGTCCCDVPGGAKTILSQKECTTTKKGQCVPLASCGLKFKRPGAK